VLEYLVSKFPQIMREQYTARGLRRADPGRDQQDRRGNGDEPAGGVQVLNTEELSKERERRQAVQSDS
jgi:hypothetical protein